MFRIPLTDLLAAGALPYKFFSTTQNGSLRCTLGARDDDVLRQPQHLVADPPLHLAGDRRSVTTQNVNVTTWTAAPYSAHGPDGRDWLSRTDGRITAAWLARGVIGFVWTANKTDRTAATLRARGPHRRRDQGRDREPDIWNSDFAYAYPDVCPNLTGVGITLFRGGGPKFPTHVVGDSRRAAPGNWPTRRAGTNGPRDRKWGDYLTCRRHSTDGTASSPRATRCKAVRPQQHRAAIRPLPHLNSHLGGRGILPAPPAVENAACAVSPLSPFFFSPRARPSRRRPNPRASRSCRSTTSTRSRDWKAATPAVSRACARCASSSRATARPCSCCTGATRCIRR